MKRTHGTSLALVLAAALSSSTGAQTLRPRDVDALPVSTPTVVESYGTSPWEVGELRVPPGKGPFPVAIVIHGGCWTKGFAQMRNTSALADALTRDGVATWNIDYRQVGDEGGGWPGTFQDWGAGADHLRSLAHRYPLDLGRVIAVGHSAGAHAALWLAAREKLPAASAIRGARPLRIRAAVAIDGPRRPSAVRGPGRRNLREGRHRAAHGRNAPGGARALSRGEPVLAASPQSAAVPRHLCGSHA